jgi:hypothetical protein
MREPATTGTRRLNQIAYRCCLLLIVLLPFDPAHRPVLTFDGWHFSALQMAEVPVALLAAAWLYGAWALTGAWPVRRSVWLLVLAVLCSVWISSVHARGERGAIAWSVDLLMGVAICLALSQWTAERGVNGVVKALVGGAALAALVGLADLATYPRIEILLLPFRAAPTSVGPYLRLTGPFGQANDAAMYFEVALCFGLAGLYSEFATRRRVIVVVMWLLAVYILLAAILLAYSRGAFLGLGMAAVAIGVLLLRQRSRGRLRVGGTRLLLIGVIVLVPVGLLVAHQRTIYALRLSTDSDKSWYQVGYQSSLPPRIRAGQTVTATVRITNRSPLAWRPSATSSYALSYHWLAWKHRVTAFATNIVTIRRPLVPGETTAVTIPVRAPSTPGRYHLLWDIVWDGATWFGLKTGQFHATSEHVLPPAMTGPSFPPSRYGAIARLPVAQPVERPVIWRLAVQTFLGSPLLGGGLQTFRTAALQRGLTGGAPRPPPTAHNVYLELLDDWGILGAALFCALVCALWWPLLSRRGDRHARSPMQFAALGAGVAYLAHGTVDCFLGVTSISILMWVVSGVAARPSYSWGPELSDVASDAA